jgi:hypothetical protein
MRNKSTSDISPSVSWICTSLRQFALAEATLDVKHTDSSAEHDNQDVCLGRIGPVDVSISHIPHSLNSADIAVGIQNVIGSSTSIKSILVTGVISGLKNFDFGPGDLIIDVMTDRDEEHSEPSSIQSLSQRALILQKEVGNDGSWLSTNFPTTVYGHQDATTLTQLHESPTSKQPLLHYRILGPAHQNSSKEDIGGAKSAQDFDAIARGLG